MGGKTDSNFTGPYDVIEEVGKGVYKFRNPVSNKILAKSYNAMWFRDHFSDEPQPQHTEEKLDPEIMSPVKRKKEDVHPDKPVLKKMAPQDDDWISKLHLKQSDYDGIIQVLLI